MTPDDHFQAIGIEKPGRLDLAVVIRARSVFIDIPVIIILIGGVTPEQIT